MDYREVEFPSGEVVFIRTEPTYGKRIAVKWMYWYKHPEWMKDVPVAPASELGFGYKGCGSFAAVGPPNFIERYFGVTHESKIKKQVDRAYREIEKDLRQMKYQYTVNA